MTAAPVQRLGPSRFGKLKDSLNDGEKDLYAFSIQNLVGIT